MDIDSNDDINLVNEDIEMNRNVIKPKDNRKRKRKGIKNMSKSKEGNFKNNNNNVQKTRRKNKKQHSGKNANSRFFNNNNNVGLNNDDVSIMFVFY